MTEQKYEYKPAEQQTVELTVPSGNVFLYRKPSRLSLLFRGGQLPQMAASKAVEAWQKDGIGEGSTAPAVQDEAAIVRAAFELRDKVLELSVAPKLVIGKAGPGECSTDDVADEDLEYLLGWVASGGDTSLMLKNFPVGQQPGAVVSPNRKVRRATAKQARGAN